MDKLANLISNLELSIRYLLSGVVIYAIYLLSLCDPMPHIQWVVGHPTLAAFVTGALGFTVYSLYRITFWVFGDGMAWVMRISAPSINRGDSILYHGAYAKFLLWRRKSGFDEVLNGYLHFRWAVVHLTYIVTFALWFALTNREPNSLMEQWQCHAVVTSVFLFVVASWQSSFLFRVEKELYSQQNSIQQSTQVESPMVDRPPA